MMADLVLMFADGREETLHVQVDTGRYVTRLELRADGDPVVSLPLAMHHSYRLHSICRLREVPEPGQPLLEPDPAGIVDVVDW